MCPELQTLLWIAAAFQLDSTLLLHIMLLNFIKCRTGTKHFQLPLHYRFDFLAAHFLELLVPSQMVWERSQGSTNPSAFPCKNHPWPRKCFVNRTGSSLTQPWSFHGSPAEDSLQWRNVRQAQPQLGLWAALLLPRVQERAESDKDSCQKEKVTH